MSSQPDIEIKATDRSAAAFKSAQHNLRNLASSAAILEGPLGAVAGRMNAVGAALGRVGPATLVAGVGIAALVVGTIKAVKAAAELEQQTLKLNAVLRATEYASGLTAQAIDDYAYSVAEATLASQQGARDASVALSSFTNVAGDQFKRTISLAQDFAAVFGGDMSAATVKFGRALDNPREGLQGLSRQFTAFNASQRNLIANMFDSGNVVGAQEKILEGLEARIGGAGVAAAGGLAGAYDTLGERVTKFFQLIGDNTGLLSLTTDLTVRLAHAMGLINDELGGGSIEDQLKGVHAELFKYQQQIKAIEGQGSRFLDPISRSVLSEAQENIARLRVEEDALIKKMRERAKADDEAAAAAERAKKKNQELAIEERIRTDNLSIFETRQKRTNQLRLASLTLNEKMVVLYKELKTLEGAGFDVDISRALRGPQRAMEDAAFAQRNLMRAAVTPESGTQERILAEQLDYRRTQITRAFEDEADTTIQATMKKNAAIEALERKHADAVSRIHIEQGAAIAGNIASVLDSVAQLYSIKTQRQVEDTNDKYGAQAAAIEEQVDAETITRAQGDAKLNELEKRRQAEQRANAKKTFEQGKKLQRAAAVINTAAGITLALTDATLPSVFARFAAAAAVAAQGVVQLATINATSFDGGGSVGAVGSAGSAVSAPRLDPGAGANGALTVQFLGDFYGWDQYMQERVIGGIRDAVDNRDVTIIGNNSRQAQELRT